MRSVARVEARRLAALDHRADPNGGARPILVQDIVEARSTRGAARNERARSALLDYVSPPNVAVLRDDKIGANRHVELMSDVRSLDRELVRLLRSRDDRASHARGSAIHRATGALMRDVQGLVADGKVAVARPLLLARRRDLANAVSLARAGEMPISDLEAPVANFHEVVAGRIYRGAQPTRRGLEHLARSGVKVIINLRHSRQEPETGYTGFTLDDERRVAEALGMRFINIEIPDRTLPTPAQIRSYLSELEELGDAPIFLHCAAGVGRTGIMVGFAQRALGVPLEDVMRGARAGGLSPEDWADHRIQASFIESYPLSETKQVSSMSSTRPFDHPIRRSIGEGKSIIFKHTLHDTTRAAEDVERAARERTSYELDLNLVEHEGREYIANMHDPRAYRDWGTPLPFAGDLDRANPVPLLGRLIEAKTFVKFDFKTPAVIEIGASLGRALPPAQRMGHAFLDVLALDRPALRVWEDAELCTLADIDRARRAFHDPDMPFEVSCHGVTEENLTAALADELARRIGGRGEIINFNLPDAKNASPDIVRRMWRRHGILTEIRLHSAKEKAYWDGIGVPYFGVTDDPALATRVDVFGAE